MVINLIGTNNSSGLDVDCRLLASILLKKMFCVNRIDFEKEKTVNKKADINIFLQNFGKYGDRYLTMAKTNILIPNQEWLTQHDINLMKQCDEVWCKTKYASKLLNPLVKKERYLGFASKDLYMKSDKTNKILHFKGLSEQKGTEFLYSLNNEITIVDPTYNFKTRRNIKTINRYISESEKQQIFNSYGIHVCPSLDEGWGHYVYESMGVGSYVIVPDSPVFNDIPKDVAIHVPCTETPDLKLFSNNKFICDSRFPFRKSCFININALQVILDYISGRNFNKKSRDFFLETRDSFERRFISFLSY